MTRNQKYKCKSNRRELLHWGPWNIC